jgi:hypothetical protein
MTPTLRKQKPDPIPDHAGYHGGWAVEVRGAEQLEVEPQWHGRVGREAASVAGREPAAERDGRRSHFDREALKGGNPKKRAKLVSARRVNKSAFQIQIGRQERGRSRRSNIV